MSNFRPGCQGSRTARDKKENNGTLLALVARDSSADMIIAYARHIYVADWMKCRWVSLDFPPLLLDHVVIVDRGLLGPILLQAKPVNGWCSAATIS